MSSCARRRCLSCSRKRRFPLPAGAIFSGARRQSLAERYGVKTLTVWDWIRKGRLTAIKLPKGYRISEESLKEYKRGKENA